MIDLTREIEELDGLIELWGSDLTFDDISAPSQMMKVRALMSDDDRALFRYSPRDGVDDPNQQAVIFYVKTDVNVENLKGGHFTYFNKLYTVRRVAYDAFQNKPALKVLICDESGI